MVGGTFRNPENRNSDLKRKAILIIRTPEMVVLKSKREGKKETDIPRTAQKVHAIEARPVIDA
jgi:hypothetical protein